MELKQQVKNSKAQTRAAGLKAAAKKRAAAAVVAQKVIAGWLAQGGYVPEAVESEVIDRRSPGPAWISDERGPGADDERRSDSWIGRSRSRRSFSKLVINLETIVLP